MTASNGWSYSAGEPGLNRVRVFEHPKSGVLYMEYRERDPGTGRLRRRRMSTGHRDRQRAKRQAQEIAGTLAIVGAPVGRDPTLRTLFDIYRREVTPTKGVSTQAHDGRASAMFLRTFGNQRRASTLTRRDWDQFIRARRAGLIELDHRPQRPVGDRQIQYDLLFLRAVLNWAVSATLLERNPLAGLPLPKERNPHRPQLDHATYEKLVAVAHRVDPRFKLAFVLAHETGHRQQAVCHLRWSDIDFARAEVQWRAEFDKSGAAHRTPLTDVALDALHEARARRPGIGAGWLFPAPRKPDQPCDRGIMSTWFRRAIALSGVTVPPRTGFHALRRKFATELKDVPLPDLCALGGWKDAKTILTCYQTPDRDTMRSALTARRPLGTAKNRGHTRGHTPQAAHFGLTR